MPGAGTTGVDGSFRTGWAGEGIVSVSFVKDGYRSKVVSLSFERTEEQFVDVALEPQHQSVVTGSVVDHEGLPVALAQVIFRNDRYTFRTVAGTDGHYSLQVYQDGYEVAAGSWGLVHDSKAIMVTGDLVLEPLNLRRGYRDDFVFDYGWEVTNMGNVAPNQEWQRGIPEYAVYNAEYANPPGDIPGDLGLECFVTGLAGNLSSNLTDTSVLLSPVFDVSMYDDPHVNYFLWFYNNGATQPDDELLVYLVHEGRDILIERIDESLSGWRERSEIRIRDYIDNPGPLRLKIFASDRGNVHIYEAAIDGFSISEGLTTSTNQSKPLPAWRFYPNPFETTLWVEVDFSPGLTQLWLFDQQGRLVRQAGLSTGVTVWQVGDIAPGVYFLTVVDGRGQATTQRVVKIR